MRDEKRAEEHLKRKGMYDTNYALLCQLKDLMGHMPLGLRAPGLSSNAIFPSRHYGSSEQRNLDDHYGATEEEEEEEQNILDLSKYNDKSIGVESQVTWEANSILKKFHPLLNLVLDGTTESMGDPNDQYKLTENMGQLGLVLCHVTSVMLIRLQDAMDAIPNPFVHQQDA
ncbi:U6 snRNA-associated Sm-like protein LSm7 [Mastomys coucha]|uniref:U6 snRNA-associated Sm-like protein LSm7 n=1 Tax=Mastomys coucha TaxID=35658 RepID=UPI0012625DFC|nr:U6 snRNA-associated Sm-like protein LSm7 [Mastomys coucha]